MVDRVRQVATRDKEVKFTTLWHHVYDRSRLREAYFNLGRRAAPGVDGETWSRYGDDLETHIQDLSCRLRRGAYRAKPVKRVYLPKPDGRQRPIGIPTLEDKIVQSSTVSVLQAIYETDFVPFSHGFRPGRGPHHALDAVAVGLDQRKVNWVLDADLRGFFDAIDHEWLMKFMEHRISDRRVLRHIRKWLSAGVLEDGRWRREGQGTPQGGSISPLLANVYLHYVFDLWVSRWRKKQAHGEMIVVRYADDFVVGFQSRSEAEDFQRELATRLRDFGLELHREKTRLLEFGRFAARSRKGRGEGKPETFDFLGFTHICADSRYCVGLLRKTMRKRMRAKLAALKRELWKRLHDPLGEVGRWLGQVLRGHYGYYGVPLNRQSLTDFRNRLVRLWRTALRRRSQRSRLSWRRMWKLADRYLPQPEITHPYPRERLRV